MEYKQESVEQLHARKNALIYALACGANRGGKSRVVKTKNNCESGWFFIYIVYVPTGVQMSWQLPVDPYWDKLHNIEVDDSFVWDGHTNEDVINELHRFTN